MHPVDNFTRPSARLSQAGSEAGVQEGSQAPVGSPVELQQ